MLVVAFIFIIAAIASMYFNGPQRILSAAIGRIFRLEPGTDFYENWMHPDEPMKFNMYVFNLTNEKEFMAGDEKANLQEIGPYVYTLKVGRTIHAMNEKNMTYTNNRNFMFRPELSNGLDAETDLVYHINLPKLLMKASGAFVNGIFDFLAEVEIFSDAAELVDQHTVHEYLWGYDYDMLEVVQSFDETKSSKFGMMEDQNGTVSQETLLPEPLSYFAPKYTVLTGKTNPSDLLKLVSFNGEKQLGCWKDSDTGKLNVTDIEQVSPGKVNADFVEVFREEAFITTKLFYKGSYESPHGENWPIPVRRYEQRRESLDGKYCANGMCDFVSSGVVDVSACRPMPLKFPLLWSSPHFYNADPDFRNNYTGLGEPEKEAHGSYIDVEPNTGVVISAKRRSQISVGFKNIPSLSHLKTQVFPMFWYDFPYDASEKIKDDMSQTLVKGDFSLRLLPFVLVILAVLLAAFSLGLQCRVKKEYSRMSVEKEEADKRKLEDAEGQSSGYASNDDVDVESGFSQTSKTSGFNPQKYDPENCFNVDNCFNSDIPKMSDSARNSDSARTSASLTDREPEIAALIKDITFGNIRRTRPQTLSVTDFRVSHHSFVRNALTTPISNTIDLEQVLKMKFST
jgi:hypothetical protein